MQLSFRDFISSPPLLVSMPLAETDSRSGERKSAMYSPLHRCDICMTDYVLEKQCSLEAGLECTPHCDKLPPKECSPWASLSLPVSSASGPSNSISAPLSCGETEQRSGCLINPLRF